MKLNKTPLILLAVFVLYGVVGKLDAADEKQEQIAYCDNVASGVWPDYNGTFKSECKK